MSDRDAERSPQGTPARPGEISRARYSQSLSPADKVFIAYMVIVSALIVVSSERVPGWWLFLIAHAAAVAVVVLIAKHLAGVGGLFGRIARDWYPVPLIPITYKELEYLIPRLHPKDYDWELAAIDYQIFGTHPTIWLERITHPILTEILQLSYVSYYLLPIVLGVVLWRKGEPEKYHYWVFIVVLGFYLSYLGYIAVPAIGPRFILADQQTFPLTGVALFETIRTTLDRAEGITRDCFPSGHTEITLLVLFYAQRFHRRTFWWLLPTGSALIVSTVYLRYHYVIDIVAGALLAAAIVLIANRLYNALGGGVVEAPKP